MKIASVPWRCGHSWASRGSAAHVAGTPDRSAGASRMSTPGVDATTSATTCWFPPGPGNRSRRRPRRRVERTPGPSAAGRAGGRRVPRGRSAHRRSRRRPEGPAGASRKNDLKELTALQRDLLRSALASVRPGGVVAYVTCSPVPAETSGVVADVVASTPGVDILDAPALLSGVPATCAADPRLAQLWPHRHGTDAIFIALLRRRCLVPAAPARRRNRAPYIRGYRTGPCAWSIALA